MNAHPNDRDIPEGENWPCHVGSGECLRPAVKILDGAGEGDFYVCAEHLPEVMAFEKMLEERPELMAPLRKAIEELE